MLRHSKTPVASESRGRVVSMKGGQILKYGIFKGSYLVAFRLLSQLEVGWASVAQVRKPRVAVFSSTATVEGSGE